MKYGRYYKQIAISIWMIFLLVVSLSATTYAWFSSNARVQTTKVYSQTAQDTVELWIGQTPDSLVLGNAGVDLGYVGTSDGKKLMPVSTANLTTFVSNSVTTEGVATHFTDADEGLYFHTRLYLQAKATSPLTGSRLALYLDESGEEGPLFRNTSKELLRTLRLGFLFEGSEPIILQVDSTKEGNRSTQGATMINGQLLGEDMVISKQGEELFAVPDPSQNLQSYLFASSPIGENTKPLIQMEWNQIYPVDVYIYIEGCDLDCTDTLMQQELDFYLAFFGLVVAEGNE